MLKDGYVLNPCSAACGLNLAPLSPSRWNRRPVPVADRINGKRARMAHIQKIGVRAIRARFQFSRMRCANLIRSPKPRSLFPHAPVFYLPFVRHHGWNAGIFRNSRSHQTLLDYLEAGETIDAFLEGFPTVTREQVIAFLEEAKARVVQLMREDSPRRVR